MNKLLLSLGLLVAVSSNDQARVCIVENFDPSGCKAGDELMFLPRTMGNEKLPIEFIGKKCDLARPVI